MRILLVLFLFLFNSLYSQTKYLTLVDKTQKIKCTYKEKRKFICWTNGGIKKGDLYILNDSTILLKDNIISINSINKVIIKTPGSIFIGTILYTGASFFGLLGTGLIINELIDGGINLPGAVFSGISIGLFSEGYAIMHKVKNISHSGYRLKVQ